MNSEIKHFIKEKFNYLRLEYNNHLNNIRKIKNINKDGIERIIFVCTGNICRSPYAEVVAKKYNFEAISCGIDVTQKAFPENNAIFASTINKMDISKHISKSIYEIQVNSSDCLVGMETKHLKTLKRISKKNNCQMTLLGLWYKASKSDIPDPYGKNIDVFLDCYEIINNSVHNLIMDLTKR